MPSINLLPWREEAKQQRLNEFYGFMGGAALFSCLLVYVVISIIGSQIEQQQAKNNFLVQETAILEQRISEIKDIRETKDNLKKRMDLIEKLQNARNLPTYLMDNMAKIVSPGVYLDKIERVGNTLWVSGLSESNNHLANTIRNVETSQWFSTPLLQKIKIDYDTNNAIEKLRGLSKFSMRVDINLRTEKENNDGN